MNISGEKLTLYSGIPRMKFGFLKIGVLALSLSAPSLCAQDWSVGARSDRADRCNFSSERSGQRFVVADFDNDQKPDSITLLSLGQRGGENVFSVRVCNSGRTVSQLNFESSEPSIIVTAVDVNQDGSPDIVIEQRYTRKRIQVWLNDGRGGFHKANVANFANPDTRAPCTIAAPSKGRHNSPPRAHLRRGKKLSIQIAKLPTSSRYSPSEYLSSRTVRVQNDVDDLRFALAVMDEYSHLGLDSQHASKLRNLMREQINKAEGALKRSSAAVLVAVHTQDGNESE